MSGRRAPLYWAAVICGVLLLSAGGLYVASAAPTSDWWVIGGGGGSDTSGSATLSGTIGQPLAYTAGNGSANLCAGFWCGVAPEHRVFLPMVAKTP